MADCGYYEELIGAGLDGQLSPEEERTLHAHLETCENCRRFYAAMQTLSGVTERDLPPAPEGLAASVMAGVRSAAPEKKKKVIRVPARSLALAAAAAVVLWAGVRLTGPVRIKGMGSAAPAAASMAEEAPRLPEPESPMAAMDTGVLARGADTPETDAAPAENSASSFMMMAPAAEPAPEAAEEAAPAITVRGEEILYGGENVSLEELEEALLRDWDGRTPVKLTDDEAEDALREAVNALLSRLEIPVE